MNIDQISPSILHVTAKENLNIQDDLTKEATKSIAQLINEEKNKDKNSEEKIPNS